MCGPYIIAYIDGRNLTSLRSTGINLDELYNYCFEANKISKRDSYWAVKDTLFLQGSKLMGLCVNNMKMKIDMDINNVSEANSNYTPKMLIISGHDHTLCVQELFIILAFGFDINSFRFPSFSSQITFEVTTSDNNKNKKNYSDYFVSYYFNEELIFNITAEEFFQKIEPNIWSEEKIDNFCIENTKSKETNESIDNTESNANNNDDINNNSSNIIYNNAFFKSKNENKGVKTALIVITSLFGVSLIANIILASFIARRNKNTVPQMSLSQVTTPV